MAAIHSTDYKAVRSRLILNIGLNFKILTYLWPVFLFGYSQLMVVGIDNTVLFWMLMPNC